MTPTSRTTFRVRRAHAAIVACVLAAGVAPSLPSSADSTSADPPPSGSSRGAAAVASLGDDIDTVAARHHLTAERLTEILTDDPSARLHSSGRVYFEDVFPEPPPGYTAKSSTPDASFAPSEAFSLHSRPGAKRIIYLDFTGHTITGTVWNGISGFISNRLAFSLDGNRSSFSTTERELIHDVWLRVSEDYAPFAIDVTTQEPTAAQIDRSSASDQYYGTRALISPSRVPAGQFSDPVCSGCAGIAYLAVFDDPSQHAYYQPAIVLSDKANDTASEIAEVVSHEVGHNLGLSHDGGGGSGEYHLGYGNWGPIMGAPYTPITQWSDGSYRGSSNTEDDLSVVASNGGTLAPDDHGGTVISATAVGTYAGLDASGVIGMRSDVDALSFTAPATTVSIQVDPAAVSPNLDVRAVLRRADGTGVVADDGAGLSACVSATVPAGTYVLTVDGTRRGNPFATQQNGYTDYGSLGRYTVRAVASCASGPRFVSQFGVPGIDPGQFQSPSAVGIGPDGDVFAADDILGSVQRFSPSGTFESALVGTVGDPSGVAVDADGDVYVSDRTGDVVRVFGTDGNSSDTIGASGSGDGDLNSPEAVAIDPSTGDVLVADTGNDRVVRFTETGTFVANIGTSGTGNGQFSQPLAVTADSAGNVYVTDIAYSGPTAVARLQKFNSAGTFTWSALLTEASETFAEPGGVAVGTDGIVYVVDKSRSLLQGVTSAGVVAGEWPTVTGKFWWPADITAGTNGDLWITDSWDGTVQRFTRRVAEMVSPTVSFTTPAAGQLVRLGTPVTLTYTCSDPAGGSGIESCRGSAASGSTIDTFTSGKKTLTVVATDRDGNAAYATRTITVVTPEPDARIRTKGTTAWIGNDADPFSSQMATARARPGRSAVCEVSLQNDARIPDRFSYSGSFTATSGYTVSFRKMDGTDITRAVKKGTYRTPVLDPGETNRINIAVKIRKSPVPSSSIYVTLSTFAVNSEVGFDAVSCLVYPK